MVQAVGARSGQDIRVQRMRLVGRTIIIIAGGAFLMATAPVGQDERLAVHQIGAGPSVEAGAPIEQIPSRSPDIEGATSKAQAPAMPGSAGTDDASGSSSSQLTGQEQRLRQPAQLYSGGKTARPLEPLSQPSDGRVGAGAVSRLAGSDRCDAADSEKLDTCRRVIETRAAEFVRPTPSLATPEQRLLSDQVAETRNGVRAAARRLAETGSDADSEDAQGIAALVLRPPAAPADEKAESPEPTAAEAALVTAILNGGGTTPN